MLFSRSLRSFFLLVFDFVHFNMWHRLRKVSINHLFILLRFFIEYQFQITVTLTLMLCVYFLSLLEQYFLIFSRYNLIELVC